MVKKKKDSFVTISVSLLFVSLLLLCGFLAYKVYTKKDNALSKKETTKNISPTMAPWEAYTNSEFGFSLEVPRLLLKEERRDKDGYKYIVIFGENSYSAASGVAIGVSDRSLEEELKQIKSAYTKNEDAELSSEEDREVVGEKGKQLVYKPKGESKDLESREVIVFHYGNYTYTVSTVPEQMEHIIESFRFL
jgi:hypothetical protein